MWQPESLAQGFRQTLISLNNLERRRKAGVCVFGGVGCPHPVCHSHMKSLKANQADHFVITPCKSHVEPSCTETWQKCHSNASTVWKPNVRIVSAFQFRVGNNWAPPNQWQHLCDSHIFWQDLLSNDDFWRPVGFTWGTQSWVPVLDGHRDATQDHMLRTGNAAPRRRGAQCRFMFSTLSHTR